MLIKYIKSVLWRVAKCLSYIEEARCLKVNWVKAHVGIQGNEMADGLAKKAAADDIGETVYDKIPREGL